MAASVAIRSWQFTAGTGSAPGIGKSEDSSINIWDVRAFGLRQHYGRAHGGSPITQAGLTCGLGVVW